jgi:ribosomal protein S18 acetylase RimI-like enzyme
MEAFRSRWIRVVPICSGGHVQIVLSIRPANDRDIEALCEIYYDFHEFHVCGVPTHLRSLGDREQWDRSYLREALGKIIKSEDSEIFVAEVAGKLAGLIEVYVRQDGDEATLVKYQYAELQSLMVSGPFRRNGVGTRLVEVAQQWAREKGATEMRLGVWEFNEAAREFYEAVGFRTLKRRMVAELPVRGPACADTRPSRASRFL